MPAPFPQGTQARNGRIVFVFLTRLYWLDTVVPWDPIDLTLGRLALLYQVFP
jgi:hypothetical protein